MASANRKKIVFIPDPRLDATKHIIPFIHENNGWSTGETYRVRVSRVYDPSKFWIVSMDKGLATFQTAMMDFYCVTCLSDAYFRAIIVNKCFGMERKIPVFLIDFGFHQNVKLSSLYHFHESYYEIPRFGVRARLSNIKPFTLGHVDPVEKSIYISPQMDASVVGSFAEVAMALVDSNLAL